MRGETKGSIFQFEALGCRDVLKEYWLQNKGMKVQNWILFEI